MRFNVNLVGKRQSKSSNKYGGSFDRAMTQCSFSGLARVLRLSERGLSPRQTDGRTKEGTAMLKLERQAAQQTRRLHARVAHSYTAAPSGSVRPSERDGKVDLRTLNGGGMVHRVTCDLKHKSGNPKNELNTTSFPLIIV